MVPEQTQTLFCLAKEIELPQTLEEMLQRVADRAAALCEVHNASVWLLDATRTRLLVSCRAGAPLHRDPAFEFTLGKGLVGWVAEKGRPLRTGEAPRDPRFLPRVDMEVPLASFLGVPLLYARACIGVLSVADPAPERFTPAHEQLLMLIAALCTPHLEIARLSRLARVDPLTGTLNQRALEEVVPQFAPSPQSPAYLLSVAIADIDSLKAANERHGHAVGDAVLRAVGQTLAGSLRVGDSVVRYGGDEFLLVLPGVALGSASRIAERLRQAILAIVIPTAEPGLNVSVGIGVAQRREGEPHEAVIARAQSALRAAQQRGGNCVQLAPM